MADFTSRFVRWFAYEQDAHAKMLASLRAAERTHAASPDYQKAVDLAAHLVAARRMWLFRLGANPHKPAAGLFPAGTRVEDVAAGFHETHALWSAWFARLTDADLSRVVEFEAASGGRFRDSVEDILTQLFGHSSYHRGQIALLLRRIGAEPAPTDFIFWARDGRG